MSAPASTALAGTATDVRFGGRWSARQRIKNDLVFVFVRAVVLLAAWLPRIVVSFVARIVALVVFAVWRTGRERVASHLEAGLGVGVGARARTKKAFERVAALAADGLALADPHEPAGRSLVLDDASREAFARALAAGRGVVFVSAHLGPWERMAALLVEEGFPVATVARESYDPRITRLYESIRAPRGVRAIYRGEPGAWARVLRELRAARAVGFLVDLPSRGVPAVASSVFGVTTEVPIGPARLALRTGAAVVVGTCANGRVTIRPLEPPDANLDRAAREQELLAAMVAALTERIAEEPEAWLGVFAAR